MKVGFVMYEVVRKFIIINYNALLWKTHHIPWLENLKGEKLNEKVDWL